MFFNKIKGLLGGISVYEKRGEIFVTGINTQRLFSDMSKVWNTGRVANHMFNKSGGNMFSFYSFFAPDVEYVLHTLISGGHRVSHNRKASMKVLELLRTETWLKETRVEHEPCLDQDRLKDFKFNPLKHQQSFFDQYNLLVPRYKLKGYMLASPPGTGKTYMGLAIMAMRGKDQVIIVSPKNAVERVWEATVTDVIKAKVPYWTSASGATYPKNCKYFIVHYEALGKLLSDLPKLNLGNVGVILDESHNFNEVKSQRTSNFVEMCEMVGATDVLWSSGTPIKAIGNEAIPFLRTVDQYFTPAVEEKFIKIYGLKAERAVDILANRLGAMMYQVDKLVVVDNKTQYEDVKVVIPNGNDYTLATIGEEMREYISERLAFYEKDMKDYVKFYFDCLKRHELSLPGGGGNVDFDKYKRYAKLIRDGYDPVAMKEESMYCNAYEKTKIIPSLPATHRNEFKHVKSIYKYVDLKVRGECLGRVVGRRRVECHVDMVDHANIADYVNNAKTKTIVFTSFVEVVERMQEVMKQQGFVPTTVYGATNKNLNGIIREFDKNPEIDPLIATYKSLSTAVPMVMANTALMFNAPFRQYEYEQAVARLDRLNQKEQVFIYNFHLDTGNEPNISTRSKDILEWSKEQVSAIMGKNYTDDVGMEEFLDELPPGCDLISSVPLQELVTLKQAPASTAW